MLAFLLAVCLSAQAQLATFGNTGFESGNASWTTSVPSGSSATLTFTSGSTNGDPGSGSIIHSGTHAFQANVTNPGSSFPSLTHSAFTAGSGSTYLVKFWLWSGGNQQVNRPRVKLHIRSGGPSYDVTFLPSVIGWDEFYFGFKASGSTTLSFTFEQAATVNVDDVQVYDQNDAGIDAATQYALQWGFQNTNNSSDANVQKTPLTGADNDIAVQVPDGRTVWLFNDSFIGHVDYTTNQRNSPNSSFAFVRNYVAIQSVDKTTFTPVITSQGTFFLPSQADQSNGGIYWPNDAILEGNNVQVLLDEPSQGGPGPLIAKRIATLSPPNYNSPTYTTTTFGNFVLNGGDGYIYIYDTDGHGGMALARAAYGNLTNPSSWQWWQGSGNSFGAKPSTLPTVPNLFSFTRSLERMGPNNFLAGGDNGNDFQFAQFPWGPWTNIARYSPVDVTTSFYSQMSNNYYYYFILHKELAQNGVYTVGYCDNGGDRNNSAGHHEDQDADQLGTFSMDQQSKCYYAPRFIKTNNLLAASPYTTTSFSDGFPNNNGDFSGWQTYGGSWAEGFGVFVIDATAQANNGARAIAKGIVLTDFTYEVDVKTGATGTDLGAVFRAGQEAVGTDAFKGYYAGFKPGTGVVLYRMDGGNATQIGSAATSIAANTSYHLKVTGSGSTLKVFVGGSTTAAITVSDGTYGSGGFGLRSFNANGYFDNVNVHQ